MRYRSPLAGEPTSPNGLVYVGNATQIEGARPDIAAACPSTLVSLARLGFYDAQQFPAEWR